MLLGSWIPSWPQQCLEWVTPPLWAGQGPCGVSALKKVIKGREIRGLVEKSVLDLPLDSVSGGKKGKLVLPRVQFGMKKVLWRRETRVESSEEEGKGYFLWEQLRANAWECSQTPKNEEEQSQNPNLERN